MRGAFGSDSDFEFFLKFEDQDDMGTLLLMALMNPEAFPARVMLAGPSKRAFKRRIPLTAYLPCPIFNPVTVTVYRLPTVQSRTDWHSDPLRTRSHCDGH